MSEQALHKDAAEKNEQFGFYSKGKIDYAPHMKNLETLLAAVREHRICEVEYRAAGRTESKTHIFAPHKMICTNQVIYALGAILQADSATVKHFSHLALHRIKNITPGDETYKGDFPDFSGNTFGLPWHEPKEFHIHFTAGKAADYVSERIWADSQEIEQLKDGSIILHITTRSEPELMAWVRSFGDEAAVETQPDTSGTDAGTRTV